MIALYRGFSPVSGLIKLRTLSPYSHAAWVCADESVFEAWKGGVTHVPDIGTNHTPGTWVELYDIQGLHASDRKRVEFFLRIQVGKPCDWLGLLTCVLAPHPQDRGRWHGAELICTGLLSAGLRMRAEPPWHVRPGDLAESGRLVRFGEHRIG